MTCKLYYPNPRGQTAMSDKGTASDPAPRREGEATINERARQHLKDWGGDISRFNVLVAFARKELALAHQPQGGDARADEIARILDNEVYWDRDRREIDYGNAVAEIAAFAAPPAPVRAAAEPGEMRDTLEAALHYLDNSDSPGGCNGRHKDCGHCQAIAKVRKALLALSPPSANEGDGCKLTSGMDKK